MLLRQRIVNETKWLQATVHEAYKKMAESYETFQRAVEVLDNKFSNEAEQDMNKTRWSSYQKTFFTR